MSKRGITTTMAAALAIVLLIVGVVIGIAASPALFPPPPPVGVVPKEEYDALKRDLDAAKADLSAVRSDLDKTKAELEALKKVGLTGEVLLGAILSLTGDLATFGENHKVAAELAAKHVNEFLKAHGAKWTLKILYEDTVTKPDIALEKVESLAARGVKFIIGPLSSAEVRAIKGYLDANKILAISQSSTAPDLGVDGLPGTDDYVFRFCPTDKLGQGPALGRIMYEDGKRYIIPVWRGDAWGDGLEKAAEKKFTELGGTVDAGIRYGAEVVEFSAEAKALADKVASAVAAYGADKVGVLHISFEEVVAFFTAASAYDVLSTVKWYGSDGTANSAAMTEDPTVREFAVKVVYPSTIFAPTRSAKYDMVSKNNVAVLGREPDSYSYAIYDAVWVYVYSLLTVDKYDAAAVRAVLPTVTKSLFGASGWFELDAAGDRQAGDYDIWAIVVEAGEYKWKHVGTYIFATDSVVWA